MFIEIVLQQVGNFTFNFAGLPKEVGTLQRNGKYDRAFMTVSRAPKVPVNKLLGERNDLCAGTPYSVSKKMYESSEQT